MQRRKQSIVTVSFEEENQVNRGYFARYASDSESEEKAIPSVALGKSLMALCREIAGVLLGKYLYEGDAKRVRQEIFEGLMEKVGCDGFQANCLIDLSLELIHVQSYGNYRRNPLELSLLIERATGQIGQERDFSAN